MSKPLVVCLMGPTASGKTDLAISLVEKFPLDIVSVDSALVYRGMNIGTAKPGQDVLDKAPHRLIDIRDPEEAYSAGNFVRDARAEIARIHRAARVPLLVGGTMLYFRALMDGIAELPGADDVLRSEIEAEALLVGWPAMHAKLTDVDPETAARVNPNDRQRIQRALEVFRSSGRTLTAWHAEESTALPDLDYLKIALVAGSRAEIHRRINARFLQMLNEGLVSEVETLRSRPTLTADSPSMRSVGYRQIWAHLDGQFGLDEATDKAQAATRQLAKRQFTWLRGESELFAVDPLEDRSADSISSFVAGKLNKHDQNGLSGL